MPVEIFGRGEFILSDYVSLTLAQAVYYKLEDGTFAGKIPPCTGVIGFGVSLPD